MEDRREIRRRQCRGGSGRIADRLYRGLGRGPRRHMEYLRDQGRQDRGCHLGGSAHRPANRALYRMVAGAATGQVTGAVFRDGFLGRDVRLELTTLRRRGARIHASRGYPKDSLNGRPSTGDLGQHDRGITERPSAAAAWLSTARLWPWAAETAGDFAGLAASWRFAECSPYATSPVPRN